MWNVNGDQKIHYFINLFDLNKFTKKYEFNESVSIHEYFKHKDQNQLLRLIVDIDNIDNKLIYDTFIKFRDVLHIINKDININICFWNDNDKYARFITNIAATRETINIILNKFDIFDNNIYNTNSLWCFNSYKTSNNNIIKNYYEFDQTVENHMHYIQNIDNCIILNNNLY